MKTLKFYTPLVNLILDGQKRSTWRLFDDKDLQLGDAITFINKDTGEVFGHGEITFLKVTTFEKLEEEDWEGHERYTSEEEMYAKYREYYGDEVSSDTEIKIINFSFTAQNGQK